VKKFIAQVRVFVYMYRIHRQRTKLAGYREPVPTTPIHVGNERLAKALSHKLSQLHRDDKVLDRGAATASLQRPFVFTSQFNGRVHTVYSYTDAYPLLNEIAQKIKHFENVRNDLEPSADFRAIRKAAKKERAQKPIQHAAA
jgi:hypothetical protein